MADGQEHLREELLEDFHSGESTFERGLLNVHENIMTACYNDAISTERVKREYGERWEKKVVHKYNANFTIPAQPALLNLGSVVKYLKKEYLKHWDHYWKRHKDDFLKQLNDGMHLEEHFDEKTIKEIDKEFDKVLGGVRAAVKSNITGITGAASATLSVRNAVQRSIKQRFHKVERHFKKMKHLQAA